MARKAYIGVNGVARKITKGYIGVNGVARRIVKAYIGIGGVARPCWASGLEYYGKVTPLSEGRTNLAAASTLTHAFFACGFLGTQGNTLSGINRYSRVIDIYDRTLTRTTASLRNMVVAGTEQTTSLNPRENLSGASVNGVAIFGGGHYISSEDKSVNDVFSVSASGTVSRVPSGQYMTSNGASHATTTVGNHVIFANGVVVVDYVPAYYRQVEAYDSSLTKKTCDVTSKSVGYRAATTVGNYAIIAGGQYGNTNTIRETTIDVYDSSLTKISSGISLSVGRSKLTATTVNGYALFAGGIQSGGNSAVVEAFDSSLTHITSVTPLSEARLDSPAVTMKDLALFLGGSLNGGKSATVDAYDGSLTRTTVPQLSEGRYGHAAATVGNFVLVGGGATDSETYASSVEAYVYS